MIKILRLYAEPECWSFRDRYPEDWKYFACGPGEFGNYLVPDVILGVNVKECCRIHDWYYRHWKQGNTEADRMMADRIFLNNMIRTIAAHGGNIWVARLRFRIAYAYYRAVRRYGAPAFFHDRNESLEYQEV